MLDSLGGRRGLRRVLGCRRDDERAIFRGIVLQAGSVGEGIG